MTAIIMIDADWFKHNMRNGNLLIRYIGNPDVDVDFKFFKNLKSPHFEVCAVDYFPDDYFKNMLIYGTLDDIIHVSHNDEMYEFRVRGANKHPHQDDTANDIPGPGKC